MTRKTADCARLPAGAASSGCGATARRAHGTRDAACSRHGSAAGSALPAFFARLVAAEQKPASPAVAGCQRGSGV